MIYSYNSLYGKNRQKTFSNVWETVDSFKADYESSGIEKVLADTSISNLYYLLYASYGNSTIANSDLNQFKYLVFSRIYTHGPTWEKRLEIQKKLRNLSESELLAGGTAIYNLAENPGTEPGTDTEEALPYINRQNTTKNIRGKIEGYANLWAMLKVDVTSDFIKGFRPLFKKVVTPELPLYYESEADDND